MSAAQPTKSFQDVHHETGIALATLFQLAAHLAYWGVGRVVHTLSWSNVYLTSPAAALSDEAARDFAAAFPRWKLPDTLAAFSQPATLGEQANLLNATMRRDLVNVVVWLLKHGLLVHCHRYVLLLVPPAPPPAPVSLSASASSAAAASSLLSRSPSAASTPPSHPLAPAWLVRPRPARLLGRPCP